MNWLIDLVLPLIISKIDYLFDWAQDKIEKSETPWDDKALRILAFIVTECEDELWPLFEKTETKLDDKAFAEFVDFLEGILNHS